MTESGLGFDELAAVASEEIQDAGFLPFVLSRSPRGLSIGVFSANNKQLASVNFLPQHLFGSRESCVQAARAFAKEAINNARLEPGAR